VNKDNDHTVSWMHMM